MKEKLIGFYIGFYTRVHIKGGGPVEGFFLLRLEHFRPDHRFSQLARSDLRTDGGPDCVEGVKIGKI